LPDHLTPRPLCLVPRSSQDFQQRIPREEVRLLEKQVKKAVKAISPHLKAVTCGSYRLDSSSSPMKWATMMKLA
jgi:hypothetical protein